MGFSGVFSNLSTTMITNAAGFIADFSPILGGLVGVAFAGYAILVIRRFIG